jgi:hypothetical protein
LRIKTVNPRLRLTVELAFVGLAALALYGGFLGNPRVFDDRVFFSNPAFGYHAMTPFGLDIRLPAYFSLAFVEVVSGRMEMHRLLSLGLHIACAWTLYGILRRLLAAGERWLALAGSLLFVVHPVAVYAAGYLVQRSIVLATLFSLLSLLLFVRGLQRGSHADALSAAAMYWLALLCKEHAIIVPAAIALSVMLVAADRRFVLRHVGIYWLACLPVAIFVVLRMKSFIGTPYEAGFDAVAAQIQAADGMAVRESPWLTSAATQMGLFYRYIALWIAPSTRWMSIDVHIDFSGTSSALWMTIKASAFLAWAVVAAVLMRRGGRLAVLGYGLTFSWVLFLVELTSVRLQEPFVLYRSYLWAPGIVIAACAAFAYAPRRIAIAAVLAAAPLLAWQAWDRLQSFSSPIAVWEDAVAKLEPGVPGGYRTLLQLGRERLYADQPEGAVRITDRCIAEYPQRSECFLARGAVALQLERFEDALPYLTRAVQLDPGSPMAHHHRGVALEELGRRNEAIDEYRIAAGMNYGGAQYRLKYMDERAKEREARKAQGKAR